MIRSMTGFGRGFYTNSEREYTVEIKAVNHRYTDINVRLPYGLSFLEDKIKKKIQEKIERGKIDISITFVNNSNLGKKITINQSLAKAYIEELKKIEEENNITNDINKDKFDVAIEYLFKIEVEKNLGIMYNRDVVLNKFSEREDIKTVFKIIFIIYEELLKKVMGLDNKFDFEKINELSSLDKDKVLRRINLVTKFIDDIDSNVNVELLLDKFVIELGDYIE